MSDASKSQAPFEITGRGWRVAMPAMVLLNLATAAGSWLKPNADVSELRMQQQLQALRDEQWRVAVTSKLDGFAQRLEAIEATNKNRAHALETQASRQDRELEDLRREFGARGLRDSRR